MTCIAIYPDGCDLGRYQAKTVDRRSSCSEEQIRRIRQHRPASSLLDAGDILTGTPLSKIAVNGAKGGGFVEMMNLMATM